MSARRVLLIDFAGTRTASSFHVWPAGLLAGCRLLTGVDDPNLPVTTAAYVSALADRVASDRPVHIMAFCLSTGIAQELARELVDRGLPPPQLTAFDPRVCGPEDLAAAYHTVASQILTADRVPVDDMDLATLTIAPQAIVADMATRLTERACLSLGRPFSTTDSLVNSLVERCMRWLRYVALAIDCRWPAVSGEANRFMSTEYDPAIAWPGVQGPTSHRVGVPQDALLADAGVIDFAAQAVAACSTT